MGEGVTTGEVVLLAVAVVDEGIEVLMLPLLTGFEEETGFVSLQLPYWD